MADYEFVVADGPRKGQSLAFPSGRFLIGSSPECELCVDGIAPRHAEVLAGPDGALTVRGLGAGLVVNGEPVTEAAVVTGTFLRLGTLELVVRSRASNEGPSGTISGRSHLPTSLEPPPPAGHGEDPLSGRLAPGTIIEGRYRLLGLIASGGMGEVYRAEHIELGKVVALKVMLRELSADPEFVARFKREAIAASRIGQQNIVDISDFGRTESGRFYFAMEYLDGVTLRALVRSEGPIAAGRAVHLTLQVARALAAAHAQAIVHRDLKPDNVMVIQRPGQSDLVKVLDFGIAKVSGAHGPAETTKVGVVVGTPAYMSPEQAKALPVDHRTDIYSLGLIAYGLLAGAPAFSGEAAAVVMAKQITETPPPFRPALQVPAELSGLLLQMLAKDPAKRPQTMDGIVHRLSACAQSLAKAPAHTGASASSSRAPSPSAASALGSYEVVSPLAVGSSTELLRARGAGGPVALRRLLPLLAADAGLASKVAAAASSAKALKHQNLVQVLDVDPTARAGLTIALELVDGLSLRQLFERTSGRGERLDPRVVAAVGAQLAAGLQSVHESDGSPHLGVSPDHVLLGVGPVVKLTDFSVPRAMLGRTVAPDGSARAPSRYAAPEVLRLERAGPAADLWSLGVLLYELLTGSLPFDGPSDAAALEAILHASLVPVRAKRPDCSEALERVIAKCLERSPVRRAASAQELREELVDAIGTGANTAAQLSELIARVLASALPSAADDGAAPFAASRAMSADGRVTDLSRDRGGPQAAPAAERLELSRAAVPKSSRLQSHDAGRPSLTPAQLKPARVELPPEGPPPLKLPALDHLNSPAPKRGVPVGLVVIGVVVAAMIAVVVWARGWSTTPDTAPKPGPALAAADPADAGAADDPLIDPKTGTRRTLGDVKVAPIGERVDEETEPPHYFVDSEPSGAQVLVNGQPRGQTPWGGDGVVGADATIELRKPGFKPWKASVDAGVDLTTTVKLKRQ